MRAVVVFFAALSTLGAAMLDPAALEARKLAALQDRLTNPWPNPATSDDGKAAYCLAAYALNQGTAQADTYILGLSNDLNDYYFANVEFLRIHADPTLSARMSPAAREKLESIYWTYIKSNSRAERASVDRIWQLDESENHNAIRRSIAYLASQTLARLPAYAGRVLDDGRTIEEHAAAWAGYWRAYFPERAKHGLEVELNSFTYVKYTVSCYYNLLDLTDDAALAGIAKTYLDLYWAEKAQAFLADSAVVGGSRGRDYSDNMMRALPFRSEDFFLGWHDFGGGIHPANIPSMITGYRCPPIISALATSAGKGGFEIVNATWGISAVPANPPYPPKDTYYVGFEGDGSGGVVRHSTVTEGYVMGTTCFRPDREFIALAEQNRTMGVLFNSSEADRIIVHGIGTTQDRETGYAEINGIAGRNCQIIWRDKRQYFSTGTRVFLSNGEVVNNEVVVGDWWFSRTSSAYVAIRIANQSWVRNSIATGKMQTLQDPWSPVIIECAPIADYPDFAEFQSAILDNAFSRDSTQVTYTSEAGDAFVIHPNSLTFPKLNGVDFDYSRGLTYDSPYLIGTSDSGEAMVSFPGYAPLMLGFGELSTEIAAVSAEAQDAFQPFVTGTDPSGTTFIEVPNGVGNANSASVTEPGGRARYAFELTRASGVQLEARVNFPDGADNSFWYRIDDQPWTVRNDGFGGGWTWISLAASGLLAAGSHTLEIAWREDGSRIEKFRLTGALAPDFAPGTIRVVDTAANLITNDPTAINAVRDFVVYDGPNRKLVVTASYEGGGGVAGVTWRGLPLTHAVTMPSSPSSNPSTIWYLDNPPIGKGDVILTFNVPTNGGSTLGVASLQHAAPGVAQTGGTVGNTSNYTTAAEDTLVVETYSANNNSATPIVPADLTPLFTGKGYSGNGGAGLALVRNPGPVANDWGTETNRPAISHAGFVSAPYARAVAGADQTVTDFDSSGTEFVHLEGSNSTVRNGSIVSYIWREGSQVIANGVSSNVPLAVGQHELTLTVTDDLGGTSSDGITVNVHPIAARGVVVAVNAGGPTLVGSDGTVYSASGGFVGGTSTSTTSSIAGTADEELYQTNVSGNWTWSRVVPSGQYTLELELAEIAGDVTAAGQRLFNVDIEGTRRIDGLDLFAVAPGKDRAHRITLPVTVDDGRLDLAFSPLVKTAIVSAIVLRAAPYPDVDSDGLPDEWELQKLATMVEGADEDRDGDGQNNAEEFISATDPRRATSGLKLETFPGSDRQTFDLRWQGAGGRSYIVFATSDLESGPWTEISPSLPGASAEMSFTESLPVGASGRFYRLEVKLP